METNNKKTIAQLLHGGEFAKVHIEDTIVMAFRKHDPESMIDFEIGSDSYDNSLEVYAKDAPKYPWEPSWEIRNEILALGFDIVYWNFADESGNFTEEIRGSEPRRYKECPERYDAKWCKDFWDKWGIPGTDNRFDGTWFDKYKRPNS